MCWRLRTFFNKLGVLERRISLSYYPLLFQILFFFFQAEDGIRDDLVTGVQTCALPIYPWTVATAIAFRAKFFFCKILGVPFFHREVHSVARGSPGSPAGRFLAVGALE